MIKIRYRQRQAQIDFSIYLDIYIPANKRTGEPKKRFYEFLNLYVSKDYSKAERILNVDRLNVELAQTIAYRKQNEISKGIYQPGVAPNDAELFSFFENNIDMTNRRNMYALHHLKKFCEKQNIKHATVKKFTKELCYDYYNYLLTTSSKKKAKRSENTVIQYVTTLKICFSHAVKKELIEKNPIDFKIPKITGKRMQFLTIEELRKLSNCNYKEDSPQRNLLRKAFLFSCFASLRISDVKRLKWSDVQNNQISIIHYKTRNSKPYYNNIQLTEQAQKTLNSIEKKGELVFDGIINDNYFLKQWALHAGIDKNISFHTARHSFGTLAASNKMYMPVLQKIMNHSNMKTTMVYADIANELMKEELIKMPTL